MSGPVLIGEAMTGGYDKGPDILHDCTVIGDAIVHRIEEHGQSRGRGMSRRFAFLWLVLTLLLPPPAVAQDVIGNAVLGGKRVELLSDSTWRFKSTNKPSKCVLVHKYVDFCGSILDWRPTKTTGTEFTAMFRYDDRHYGGLIIENIGLTDGYNSEFMRTVVLGGAADASGVPIEHVPVYDVFDATLDNKIAETLIYGARIDGVGVVFSNTIFIGEQLTVQAVVWAIGTEFSQEHKEITQNFTTAVKITTKEPVH